MKAAPAVFERHACLGGNRTSTIRIGCGMPGGETLRRT
jgi:hypothetical protein